MIIKFLLIVAIVLLLVLFLRHHGTSRGRATAKIAFILFMVFGIIAVLKPGAVTALADVVGVGRGTDLVLYGLVVAFGFTVISTSLRFRHWELRVARLTRALALRDAEPPAAVATEDLVEP